MGDDEELGSDSVTARTRAFEEIDAQVFPGPGRGATRSEAAASDRWGGPSPATVEAYRRMFDLVVKHGLAQSSDEPPPPQARRLSVRHQVSNTAVASRAPTSSATSHQRKTATQAEERHD